MATDANQLYLNKLGKDFCNYFEQKTGKKIDSLDDVDANELVSYYGGRIEYRDLYDEVFRLNTIIYASRKTFKLVIDNKISENLKQRGNGEWVEFVMDMLYCVSANRNEEVTCMEEIIVYPNPKYVDAVLKYKEISTEGDIHDEANFINGLYGFSGSLDIRRRFVKRYNRIAQRNK